MPTGSVEVKVSSKDLRARMAALASVDERVAKVWRDRAYSEVAVPWVRDLAKAAPKGRKGDAAGRSIQAARGVKPAIVAGKGSWPGDHGHPWQPFFAMEYGMHRGAYTTYMRRTNRGAVAVRRRVRTWALPYSRNGKWFRRALNRSQRYYRGITANLIDDIIREELS